MKNLITFLVVLITTTVIGQETRLCYSGSVEYVFDGEGQFWDAQYNFTYTNDILPSDCSYSVVNDTEIALQDIGLNIFTDAATVVNNDQNVYSGSDPSLLINHSISLPRVYEGSQAIKLNDTVNDKSVTSMTFSFQVTEPVISFKYSLIASNPPSSLSASDVARFIVNIRDGLNQNLLDSFCITIENNDPDFFSTGTSTEDLLYTGWQCKEFEIDTSSVSEINIQFIVMDDSKGVGFHTAYIDAICDEPCCPQCPTVTTDVGSTNTDEIEAEVCIIALNTISDTASAIYHAGEEVLLQPGFEALSGTTDRFYIEGCTGQFALRPGNDTGSVSEQPYTTNEEVIESIADNLTIYPNPVQDKLTIQHGEARVTTISLYGVDGKIILQLIPDGNTAATTINTSTIAKGIYILSVETNDGTITTAKIVKN